MVGDDSIIIMCTYKISVGERERAYIVNALKPGKVVVLCENNSDTCYFIIPETETEMLLKTASALNRAFEKISISELKEKYSTNSHYTLSGDSRLVAALFQ